MLFGSANPEKAPYRIIEPVTGHATNTGAIRRRERLGGTLKYYYRAAA